MLQRIVIASLCLAFSLSSSADDKRTPASAAGKAAAMKYILGRKPAQEQPAASKEEMNALLKQLYAQLDENRPNQEKVELIQVALNRIGSGLGVMIKNNTEDAEADYYHNASIFLAQLRLTAAGTWDIHNCMMVYTIAKNNNVTSSATDEQVVSAKDNSYGLTPITEEIKKVCCTDAQPGKGLCK
jgi:hypothetical protein